MPSNHHHTLLYFPGCAEGENFLKQIILQVLSTTNNAHVKLMIVSYPEKFLRAQTNNKAAANSISVRGEKMKSVLTQKTTEGLGCKCRGVWEYEKHSSLGASVGSEKALYFFNVCLSLKVQMHLSKRAYCYTLISFKKDLGDLTKLSTTGHWILIWG